MKLLQYELILQVKDTDKAFFRSPARGALMHGLLMNEIGGRDLHANGAASRPFSQYLLSEGNQARWIINILDERAEGLIDWIEERKRICTAADSEDLPELFIEHSKTALQVQSIELTQDTTYEKMFAESLEGLPPKFVSFDFLTPLVFKKSGQERPHPFPEARLIVQSALSRWNAFSDCAKFDEKEILEEFNKHASTFSFRLHSQHVAMDRIDFAGSLGNVSYVIQKSELRQIMDLCGRFAEFAGLGAKTAMGLGATNYHPQELRREESSPQISQTLC